MTTERTTILVSVNANDDEEARIQKINRHVGEGWRVASTIPVSGGGVGPGGASEDFLRLQVNLERTIDEHNVIVTDTDDARDHASDEEE